MKTLPALLRYLTVLCAAICGAHAQTAPDAKPKTEVPTVFGERFTRRQVVDQQQGGIVVCAFMAPATWKDKSQVNWTYSNMSNPVAAAVDIENPANEEACFLYPAALFFCLRPDSGYNRPGQSYGGLIYSRNMGEPAPTLLAIVQRLRAGMDKFKIIGFKDMPDLPKALHSAPSPNQKGVGVKVTYELHEKPVEEEFYGVFDFIKIPYDGPQGRTWQINWGITTLHSFRAPEGSLEKRLPIFTATMKSFKPNPAWQERLKAVNAYLAEEFDRQLKAGYDNIAAAGRLSKQISANNDAMLARIDKQLAASQTAKRPTGTEAESRTATDRFDDNVRGVETVDDPYWGTTQRSFTEQYHWTDGYGSYKDSNDPTYDPNKNERTAWQLMQPTR
jgi:hypothetical protein